MTPKTMKTIKTGALRGVEKQGIIVTLVLVLVNLLFGSHELALGAGLGGVIMLANFLALRWLVSSLLINKSNSKASGIFTVILKMVAFIGAVVILFFFLKISIYGFLIGVTAIWIVIIGESLRSLKDGTL